MTLLVVGNISIDTIEIDNQKVESIGGGAFYVALAASLAGCPTYLAGLIGADFPIHLISHVEQLKLDYLKLLKKPTTRFHLHYDSSKNLQKVVSSFCSHSIRPRDLFPTPLKVNAAHITCKDPFAPKTFLGSIHASFISTDVSSSSLERRRSPLLSILPHARYIFMNIQEYQLFKGWIDLIDYPNLSVIVTMGENGLKVYNKKFVILEIPAYLVDVIDPTGAGDTLAGGCMGMLSQNMELIHALSFGSAIASVCVQGWGASSLLNSSIMEFNSRTQKIMSRAKCYD